MNTYAKFLVSLVLLATAIHILDTDSLLHYLSILSIGTFLISITINLLSTLITGIRWHNILSAKIQTKIFPQLILYFKSNFFNTFTPANLGGDTYRFLVLKNKTLHNSEILYLLLRERIIGLYGYILVFITTYLSLIFINKNFLIFKYSTFYFGITLFGILFFLPFLSRLHFRKFSEFMTNRLSKRMSFLVETFNIVFTNLFTPKGSSIAFSLTFLGIILWIVSIKVIANGFGLNTSVLELAFVATLVEMLRLIPITVQGIGLRESMFAYILSVLGYNPELSFAVGCTVYLALSFSIMACGPVGYLLNLLQRESEL